MSDTLKALDQLVYNVTVVTVGRGGAESGLCVSWITQVAHEPPVLAFSVDQHHTSLEFIRSTKQFVVNILPASEKPLAVAFTAQATRSPSKVDAVATHPSPDGAPILDKAIAWLECEVLELKDIGDHTIVLGKIEDGGVLGAGEPMTSASSGLRYHKSKPR
jgi:flavin reductase (DIM6/NTAB) family NADH-FMN oxidoreductase RutF